MHRLVRLKLLPGSLPSITSRLKPTPRYFTQGASVPPPPRFHLRSWLSPFLTVILFAGLGATAYGLYEIYDTLTLWPPEVRSDLRSGLRAKHRGDLDASEQYLQRAWTTAKSLPNSLFAPEPHLKISGIAICLASVLEQNNKLERAFEVYEEALERLPQTWEGLSGKEKLRAVGVAYKLGEMAGSMKGKEEKEEGYLAWAVESLLKGAKSESQVVMGKGENENDDPMMNDLQLPEWATKTDVAAPFEALGSFYARTGKTDYAMVLYLHAISILIPPPPQSSTVDDRCRGAQLMTALSDLIMRNADSKPFSAILHQAEQWSNKALEIAMQHSANFGQHPTCDVVLAVAAYNIGILKQMMGDKENAKLYLERSLEKSKEIGMEAGVQIAEETLRKADEGIDVNKR